MPSPAKKRNIRPWDLDDVGNPSHPNCWDACDQPSDEDRGWIERFDPDDFVKYPVGKGRKNERKREGVNGGRVREGESGGAKRGYHIGYYRAKSKGKGALRLYVGLHGWSGSKGGKAFHRRKDDAAPRGKATS